VRIKLMGAYKANNI